jgi:hypothetical protein
MRQGTYVELLADREWIGRACCEAFESMSLPVPKLIAKVSQEMLGDEGKAVSTPASGGATERAQVVGRHARADALKRNPRGVGVESLICNFKNNRIGRMASIEGSDSCIGAKSNDPLTTLTQEG